MGLDMHLYAEKHFMFRNLKSEFWKEEYKEEFTKENENVNKLMEIMDVGNLVDNPRTAYTFVKVEVGYWRKANAIHKYFVDKCANGKDDCEEVYVYQENFEELMSICNQLLESKDTELAMKLLPTASGFFFGGVEYDEWYFKDLEHTRDILKKVLADKHDFDYIYRASWQDTL